MVYPVIHGGETHYDFETFFLERAFAGIYSCLLKKIKNRVGGDATLCLQPVI